MSHPTLAHGLSGTSWEVRGSLFWLISNSRQTSQVSILVLISADIPGQNRHSHTKRRQSFHHIGSLDSGTTTLSPLKTNPSCVHNSSQIWKYGTTTEETSLFSGHPFMIVSFKAHNRSSLSAACLRSLSLFSPIGKKDTMLTWANSCSSSGIPGKYERDSKSAIVTSLPGFHLTSVSYSKIQEHALKTFRCTMKWFLLLMELGQTEHHRQTLFFQSEHTFAQCQSAPCMMYTAGWPCCSSTAPRPFWLVSHCKTKSLEGSYYDRIGVLVAAYLMLSKGSSKDTHFKVKSLVINYPKLMLMLQLRKTKF